MENDNRAEEVKALKRQIQGLTDEKNALNALRVELEEMLKHQNESHAGLIRANGELINGLIYVLCAIGRGMKDS